MRERPKVGDVTEREKEYPVCTECGVMIEFNGECAYGCPQDCDDTPSRQVIRARYKTVNTFIGDTLGKFGD